jgi:hypothetical protein
MVTAALGISVAAVDNPCPRMLGLLCAPGHGLSDALPADYQLGFVRLCAGTGNIVITERRNSVTAFRS